MVMLLLSRNPLASENGKYYFSQILRRQENMNREGTIPRQWGTREDELPSVTSPRVVIVYRRFLYTPSRDANSVSLCLDQMWGVCMVVPMFSLWRERGLPLCSVRPT